VIECGVGGQHWERMTTSPGADLLQTLNRILETDYRNQPEPKKKSASST
jgi:hypothetical protein